MFDPFVGETVAATIRRRRALAAGMRALVAALVPLIFGAAIVGALVIFAVALIGPVPS